MQALAQIASPVGLITNEMTQTIGQRGQLAGPLSDEEARVIGQRLSAGARFASDLAASLRPFDADSRTKIAAAYLGAGGDPSTLEAALRSLSFDERYQPRPPPTGLRVAWGILATASFAASVYHGYKRNDSVGWAIWWGAMGALFPVITPTIALAQGFAKPKR